MDEFVIVDFPSVRRVDADGMANGVTQSPIRGDTGRHTFDLATPLDYTPPSRTVDVCGTSNPAPMHVEFFPMAALAVVGAARAVRGRKRPKPPKKITRVKDARPDTLDFRDQMFLPTLVEVPVKIDLLDYWA